MVMASKKTLGRGRPPMPEAKKKHPIAAHMTDEMVRAIGEYQEREHLPTRNAAIIHIIATHPSVMNGARS